MKKFTGLLLAVLIVCVMFPVMTLTASAEGGRDGNINWEIDGVTLTVSAVPGTDGKMNNFSNYDYAPWYKVGDKKSYEIIEKIIVEDGVANIGNYAFCYFSKVKMLSLPKSCKSIGYEAFYECEGLEEVSLCGNVEEDAFVYCYGLQNLIINDGCSYICQEAFSECYALKYLTLPSTLSRIDCEAFEYDTKLKNVIYYGTKNAFSKINISDDDNEPLFEAINGQNGRKITYKETGTYSYIDKNGNQATLDGNKETCFILKNGMTELNDGWYIVDSKLDFGDSRLEVTGNANILLKNNCGITTSGGIGITTNVTNKSLNIYSESLDTNTMGYINVTGAPWNCPGIGPNDDGILHGETRNVNICGGTITSKGGNNGAGIGNVSYGMCNITISNGNINATGGNNGAGIGSGYHGNHCSVTIACATVKAKGGENGAGIGSGESAYCNVKILSGNIEANGGSSGAGIGGGDTAGCDVNILSGNINAKGGEDGAGIGSGYRGWCNVTISKANSKITAHGGQIAGRVFADNIGCGFYGSCNVVYDPEPSGFTLSGGNIWIIAASAIVILGGIVATVLIVKKKKKKIAVTDIEEITGE